MLTGESIIFQNETLELFKTLINLSQSPLDRKMGGPLKVRYVSAIILEFVRSIYEEGIPLQPQHQNLFIAYLLNANDYALLH